ncbi:hypothetical protein [Ralstonia solanacearum]|nr:hypothetical protein [Ralstonia solanacearum]
MSENHVDVIDTVARCFDLGLQLLPIFFAHTLWLIIQALHPVNHAGTSAE